MQTALAVRAAPARPVVAAKASMSARRFTPATAARRSLRVCRSAPEQAQIEKAIKEAEEACKGDDKGECATAWDTVEELSAAAAHAKAAQPTADRDGSLTNLCEEDPSADECRVYDD